MREAIVAALSRDYGVHAYGKWRGAFWRLASLVDLGVEPGHSGALAAAEQTLDWLSSPSRLSRIHKRAIDGRVRRCASQDGLRDPRTADALDYVESKRLPDGRWRTEGKWWKRPGSKGSNVEAVDWGETANKLLTERALSVLGAAGR